MGDGVRIARLNSISAAQSTLALLAETPAEAEGPSQPDAAGEASDGG